MLRLLTAGALMAPTLAFATTCPEYVAMMRAEGIRTLVRAECASQSEADAITGHWNEILAGPYGSCLASRFASGDPATMGLMVYMQDMNRLKDEQGCPPEAQ